MKTRAAVNGVIRSSVSGINARERLAHVRVPGNLTTFLPTSSDFPGIRSNWRADLVAGVTVGVVALPLALAFGITTGLGAAI